MNEFYFRKSRKRLKSLFSYIISLCLILVGVFIFITRPLDVAYGFLNSSHLVFIIFGLFIVIRLEIKRRLVKYALNKNMISEIRGLLRKNVLSINLMRVTDIQVRQGIVSRILGIANIEIYADQSRMMINGVDDYGFMVQRIMESIGKDKTEPEIMQRFPTLTGRGILGAYR